MKKFGGRYNFAKGKKKKDVARLFSTMIKV